MDGLAVRYIVDDVDEAIAFYEGHLGFTVEMRPAPGFAALSNGALRLFLNAPGAGGAGTAGGDGSSAPSAGGWNRFQLPVEDLDEVVASLDRAGCVFRGGIVEGKGGRQVLVEDPAGNPIELFEPRRS